MKKLAGVELIRPITKWVKYDGEMRYAEIDRFSGKYTIKIFLNRRIARATAFRVGGRCSAGWPFTIIKSFT